MFNTEVTDLVKDSSTPSFPQGGLNFINLAKVRWETFCCRCFSLVFVSLGFAPGHSVACVASEAKKTEERDF